MNKFSEATGLKIIYFTFEGFPDNDEYHQKESIYYNNLFVSKEKLLNKIISLENLSTNIKF